MTNPSELEGLKSLVDRLQAERDELEEGWNISRMEWARLVQAGLDRALTAERERDELRKALEPFAKIVPSSMYPPDGSEDEQYVVILQADRKWQSTDFTGADLARARQALSLGGSGEASLVSVSAMSASPPTTSGSEGP